MRSFLKSLNPLGWAFLAYTFAAPISIGLYTGLWPLAAILFVVCVAYLIVSP